MVIPRKIRLVRNTWKENPMTKTTLTVLSTLFFLCISTFVQADIINTGQGTGAAAGQYKALYRTLDSKGNEVFKEKTIWGTGINAAIVDDAGNVDQSFAACVDLLTNFKAGTEYNAYDLFDSEVFFITEQQKTDIVSLVSHTYEGLFTEKLNWRGDVVMVASGIRAFQFALWEILQEDPSGAYSLSDGWFQLLSGSNETNQAYLDEAMALADSWLAAVSDTSGTLWSEMGYDAVDYDYTIWIPADGKSVSQSLLTVAPASPAATPEPASILIFGVGLAGFGLIRRRKK